MAQITIEMDDADFEGLITGSAYWAQGLARRWDEPAGDGRFEHTRTYADRPGSRWTMAYWVGSSWVSVLLCRAFLTARGYQCEVLRDRTDPAEYVVLTDYLTPRWACRAAQ